MGPQRLQHRLRGAARPGRAAGRPHRPAADVLRRAGLFLPPRPRAASRRRSRSSSRRASCRPSAPPRSCPTSLALLLPEFPLEQRATATGIGARRAPSRRRPGRRSAALLVDAAGWRWVFFVNLVFGLARARPGAPPARETRDAEPRPAARRGRRRPARRGVGLLSLGHRQGPDWGWGGGACSARSAAGACCCSSRCGSGPAASPVARRRPGAVRACARSRSRTSASSLFSAGFYALLLGNVLFLTARLGLLGAAGRLGPHPRPAHGGGRGGARRPARRPLRPARRRAPGRRCCSRLGVRRASPPRPAPTPALRDASSCRELS